MALKVLMLKKRLDEKRAALAALEAKDAEFSKREADLEASIGEAKTDEEQKTVEEAVDAFESEKKAHEENKGTLRDEIAQLESDIAAEENRQKEQTPAPVREERKEKHNKMEIRDKFFKMTYAERDAMFARDDVKNWIGQVRSLMKRDAGGVNNAKVLIPQVMLPILRELIEENSKLLKHVNLQRITGDGRQTIDGGFPEAVWTEMCGSLNELQIGFYDVTVSGYKVGGFISVCNALLEDSDVALATDILTKLGRGIGYAVDKSIIFGTGTKMPLGILPRLAQTSEPAGSSDTARPWVDLHTSNIQKITAANSTGLKLFQGIVSAFGAADNKFSNGPVFWVMNNKTKTKLTVEAMAINASGAIVSGMGGTMPIIGGAIELLDFIPDNVIIGGYEGLYLMAERAGLKTGESEHFKFTDDQTVFKATARYDGKPVVPEGFVAIGINNTDVDAAAVDFTVDTANSVQGILLNTDSETVAVGGKVKLIAKTWPGKGTVTWASGTAAKATVDANGEVTGVAAGSSVITATCNGKTASCTVTVTG